MEGKVLIESLHLKSFLSYGPESEAILLSPLNVLIGPNGSGKSNLIEAIGLLRVSPTGVTSFLRRGGFQEWVWKGDVEGLLLSFKIETLTRPRYSISPKIFHSIEIFGSHHHVVVMSELIRRGVDDPEDLFINRKNKAVIYRTKNKADENNKREAVEIDFELMGHDQSVLSYVKDFSQYSEITQLAQNYSSIRIYRNWDLGRNTPSRQPQPADLANDFLEEDASNLALVINDLQNKPGVKGQLIKRLQQFNPLFDDITTKVYGNTVQLFLHEKGLKETIPATRLSDGTLQFLCLLAILCHPEPPPLVCIEEPELGLHPDVMPILAELFLEASQRMQLIVSTHSDALVSALSSTPEAILVCERDENGTQLKRLEAEPLAAWLEKYSLGDLWRMGEIGGVRW